MRKTVKVLLLAGGALCALGLILGCIVGFSVGWDNLLGATNVTQQQYRRAAAGLSTIQLQLDARDITVCIAQGDEISLQYVESDQDQLEIVEQDDSLLVREPQQGDWLRRWFASWWQGYDRSVRLYLPARMAASLSLASGSGNIQLQDSLALDGDVTLSTHNGALTLSDLSAGNVTLTTSNGAIRLANVVAQSIQATTSNGSIDAQRLACAGTLRLTTSNGRIAIHSLAGQDIALVTSNSSVTAQVQGALADYRVHSQTRNGENTLPGDANANAAQSLTVITDNGDIDVTFSTP